MATATLNVRLPEELKRNGDRVLENNGISVSEAVRSFYRMLESDQDIPKWLSGSNRESEDIWERRKGSLEAMVGIVELPADFDIDTAKRERLARYLTE